MPYRQAPKTPITSEQAVALVQEFISERAASGVLMASAFTDLELVEGALTATWSEAAIGQEKSDILLELNPFENLAEWLSTPLSVNQTLTVRSGAFGRQRFSTRRATDVRTIVVAGPARTGLTCLCSAVKRRDE